MFRGSSYSMETDKDVSFSHLNEENVNLALVGVSEVGKSSLLNCIEKEQFSEDISPTNGFQLRFKKIRINHHLLVNLAVWDASGDRMAQYIQEGRLRHFDGILYVYDLTNPHSVIQLEQLYEEVRGCDHGELVSIVVGNKVDLLLPSLSAHTKGLESTEAFYLAKKFSERHRLLHQSVSAKLNSCVADCFILIIKEALSLRRHIRTSRLGEEEELVQLEAHEKCKPCCHSCTQCSIM